jgi:type VI secretion system protein ImpF
MERKRVFLPTLLQRLMDDEPKVHHERHDKFNFDPALMRKLVQQHVAEILNTTNLERQFAHVRYQHSAASVINYGIAPLAGIYSTPYHWAEIEKTIRSALIRFEPRLISESIIVNQLANKREATQYGIVHFEIRGLIKWQPHPLDLCVAVDYDTEINRASLSIRR